MSSRIWSAVGGAGVAGLRLDTREPPKPGPGEVLLKVRAATLNYRDLLFLTGRLPGMVREPSYVPLCCGTGVVEALGEGVSGFSLGQRAVPLYDQDWISGGIEQATGRMVGAIVDGMAADHVVLSAQGLCAIPDALGDFDAATLTCAGVTAWSAVFKGARATVPGDVVVVQGTGGVAMAALQFAKAAGAQVIVTSSCDTKLARAKALGADHGINYRSCPDWASAVRTLTGGRGADLLVDVVGKGGMAQAEAAVHDAGSISAVGLLSGDFLWGAQLKVPVSQIVVGNRQTTQEAIRAMAMMGIRPVVDRIFPLERLGAAFAALEQGAFFGKIGISFE